MFTPHIKLTASFFLKVLLENFASSSPYAGDTRGVVSSSEDPAGFLMK
jgi:hypothetical protein